jgi:hypothetical protein
VVTKNLISDYWIFHVVGNCCGVMFTENNPSSDADYRIGKIPILLPLRIRCVLGLYILRFCNVNIFLPDYDADAGLELE